MNMIKIAAIDEDKVTYAGIDWNLDSGKKQILNCAICHTMHIFSVRTPKRCRKCMTKFVYTAAQSDRGSADL